MKFRPRILLMAALLLSGERCANEKAISGGPKDETPPQVIAVKPELGALQVPLQPTIELRFSEQMERKSLEGAVQIWPRPEVEPEISSGWTWLKIHFQDRLEEDQTYLVTLDKTARDLQNNGLSESFVLAFSTGDSLNQGTLRGRVQGTTGRDGRIFLYARTDTSLHALRATQAQYEFQPDDSGRFHFSYLAEQEFSCFYHEDLNHNQRIDGGDRFARTRTATVFPGPAEHPPVADLWPQEVLPQRVRLLSLTSVGSSLLQVRFSRPVDPWENQDLVVHQAGLELPVRGACPIEDDPFALLLDMVTLPPDSTPLWVGNFQDSTGSHFGSDTLPLIPGRRDSIPLQALDVRYHVASGSLDFLFNRPILSFEDSAIRVRLAPGDSLGLPGNLQQRASPWLTWQSDSVLERGQDLTWEIFPRDITAQGVEPGEDSLFTGRIMTLPEDSLGGLELEQTLAENGIAILSGGRIRRQIQLTRGEKTHTGQVPAGQYELVLFEDRDGDGSYDPGGMERGEVAEPFWVWPEAIRIRARWVTDLGVWTEDGQ